MFLLLVVGVMDDARADILGDGKINLSFVEHFSQVCCVPFKINKINKMYVILIGACWYVCVPEGVMAASNTQILHIKVIMSCKHTSLVCGLIRFLAVASLNRIAIHILC